MEYRYKPGQEVRVRHDLDYDGEYLMRSGPNKNGDALIAVDNMVDFAGKIVRITRYSPYGDYRVKEDGERWRWTDDMFDGPADGVSFTSLL